MQDTGQRGWVPAWFIGKLGTSDSQPSSAGTATASSAGATTVGTVQSSTDNTGVTSAGMEEKRREEDLAGYDMI